MSKIKVKEISRVRDGGSICYEDQNGVEYVVDGRIGTATKGSIYDRWPGKDGAIKLDVELDIVEKF